MKRIVTTCFAAAATVFAASGAATWYVDDDNYNEAYATAADYIAAGFDGTTPAKAFGTIQIAIDATTTKGGDTIFVCPGIYDKGDTEYIVAGTDCGKCRINVRKTVRIESLEGAGKTHIVGARDSSTESGRGPNAVRCIGNWATKPVIKGFTLRDGATDAVLDANGKETESVRNRGGALYSYLADYPAYIVDCVVSNCNSSAGGTFRFGTVIRSLVVDNVAVNAGGGLQTVYYSSIFSNNRSINGWMMYGTGTSLSHCTIVDNDAYRTVLNASCCYNNIVINSASSASDPEIAGSDLYGNVFGRVDGIYQLVAPAAGDFRVRKGSAAETACVGSPADGSEFSNPIPEEFRGKDFYGNPITEGCVAGAVQGAVETVGGALQFNGLSDENRIAVNGWGCSRSGTYAFSTEYPAQFLVSSRVKTGKLYAWITSADHGDYHVPDAITDSLYLMPPPQPDVVMTNTLLMANGEIWLDPDEGSDEIGVGTKASPYKTLQKGSDSAKEYWFVYCKRGSYDSGEKTYWSNDASNRVTVSKSLRFVAVDGSDETFIVGAADADSPVETQPGCGPKAVRGVAASSNYTVFERFTFRNCHTLAQAAGEGAKNGHQGCVLRCGGNLPTIMDCVIEANCGSAANAVTGARVIRSWFKGLKSGVPAYSTSILSGCLLENCSNSKDWPSGTAYHCTLRESGIFGQNIACIASGGLRAKKTTYVGSIVYDFDTYDSGVEGLVNEDPLFTKATGVAVRRASPAFACGEIPTAGNYGADYYKYASTDYYGSPIAFIDGKPVAGADQSGTFLFFDRTELAAEDAPMAVTESVDGKVSMPAESILSLRIPAEDGLARNRMFTFTVPAGAVLSVVVGSTTNIFIEGVHDFMLKASNESVGMQIISVNGTCGLESLRYYNGIVFHFR